MLTITGYSVEIIKDPFGILSGERYEFFLDIDVPDDDELYSENGIHIRVLYMVGENKAGIVTYDIIEKGEEKILDFELEAEEEAMIQEFCREHIQYAE
jgi:hypothetical protein